MPTYRVTETFRGFVEINKTYEVDAESEVQAEEIFEEVGTEIYSQTDIGDGDIERYIEEL